MLYCDLTYLQGLMPPLAILECCDDANAGEWTAAALAVLEACNVSAVMDVHLHCRGMYTVPFDPVPAEIVELTAQLTKYYLLVRRVGEDVSDALTQLYRRLSDKLRAITVHTFKIDSGGDVVAEGQGPLVRFSRKRFRQGFLGELLDDDCGRREYPFDEV